MTLMEFKHCAPGRNGLTRNLPGDEAERFFALGFAIEQMHNNFKDLGAEWAGPSKEAERKNTRSY